MKTIKFFFLYLNFCLIFYVQADLYQSLINFKTIIKQISKALSLSTRKPHQPAQSVSFNYPNFHVWNDACSKLPYFRKIGPNYTHKPLLLDEKEITRALLSFTLALLNSQLTQPAHWVLRASPDKSFFDLSIDQFKPYAQKIEFPEGSQIALHGDLHGDIHSLCHYLKQLSDCRLYEQRRSF